MNPLVTEQTNFNTADIDKLSTLDALRLINAEDKLVAAAVEKALPNVAQAVDATVARLKVGGRLFYVGAGTSGRLGVLDAAECPPTFGVAPEMVCGVIAGGYDACHRAVEASEDDPDAGVRDMRNVAVGDKDVVVGISASGSAPYVLGAIRYARSVGAMTIGVCCNRETHLAQAAQTIIEALVGPEVIAGSTRLKAGTAQKLILNMLSTLTMIQLGYALGNRMTNLQVRNEKLRRRAISILTSEYRLDESAARAVLEGAQWDVRIAQVMCEVKTDYASAEAALRRVGFIIKDALHLLEGKTVPQYSKN